MHCAAIMCKGMVVVSCGSGSNVGSIVFGGEGIWWSFGIVAVKIGDCTVIDGGNGI